MRISWIDWGENLREPEDYRDPDEYDWNGNLFSITSSQKIEQAGWMKISGTLFNYLSLQYMLYK